MKVRPLAADSMGVRSMATLVETKDVRILIDPAAALGPYRYGLPPHPEEEKALEKTLALIDRWAAKSDILVVSHYHYDHHDPKAGFYDGQQVLAKDWNRNVNRSQKRRGAAFEKAIAKKCELEYCDGEAYEIGNMDITFSPPVPHGPPGTMLGYVVMTCVDDGRTRFIHTSDVQGPVDEKAAAWLVGMRPDVLYVDGPPTYLLGYKFGRWDLDLAARNIVRVAEETGCQVIMDHHLPRDMKYRERFTPAFERINIKTAAEYLGRENATLEALRKELHGGG